MNIGGLIAGALKGAGEGYTAVAKGELENQQKVDYAKQILEMQQQKELLIDEVKRGRDIRDIGLRTAATASADAAAAPVVAKGRVAGEAAGTQAALESNLPQLKAKVAKADFDANRDLNTDKATQAGKDAAAGQVAKTGTPGYLDSVSRENLANGATQLKAAEIGAAPHWAQLSKPSIQADSEGNYYTISWDPKTNKVASAQITTADGKPLKGMKDLDTRTKVLAESFLVEAKDPLTDPERRERALQTVRDLLSGKDLGGTSNYKAGDKVTLKNGGTGTVVEVNGKLVVKPD